MNPSFLIIEDDPLMRKSLENICRKNAYRSFLAANANDGMALFEKHDIDVVLLDMRLPDGSGMDVLSQIRRIDEEAAVIMMTAFPDVKSAVETIKNGAFDYVIKPFEVEELRQTIKKALEIRSLKNEVRRLQRELPDNQFEEILGSSPEIKKVKALIAKVGQAVNTPVFIIGASGTGKELTANAVHSASERRYKPMVKINCSALPEHLLESELFGYEKGAFSGATQRKAGLFELANGGSLFLDEISEMQPNMQPKLLRVLEGHPFKRLGGTKDIQVDVRIIAASNKNIERLVKQGLFREDLYYRLSVFVINLPNLRERQEDILLMAHYFLEKSAADMRKSIKGFTEEARSTLQQYPWPGNIRELRNMIERAVILCDENIITAEHLPSQLLPAENENTLPSEGAVWNLQEVERRHILWVLEQTGGNKSEAVRRLGIARSTFDEKLKKYKESLP
ncbi:MAG: sigma-54-dependent transcriptional regulator [bacterium]